MRALRLIGLGFLVACGRLGPLEPVDQTVIPAQATAPQGTAQDAGATAKADAGDREDAGPSRTITLYPILMVHGFGVAPGSTAANFGWVLGALQDAGYTAVADTAPAYDSIAVRGATVLSNIEDLIAQTGAPAVNIIAQSMGGLDSRYVASPGGLGRGDLIASVTTISTPHRGTALADAAEAALPMGSSPLLSAFSAAFDLVDPGLNLNDPGTQAAILDLSEAYAVGFNQDTPDDPQVYYQSWAGLATATGDADPNDPAACHDLFYIPGVTAQLDTELVPLAGIVGHGTADWPNDGVVAVESSAWDDFHGCIPADHFNEIGVAESGPFPDPDPATGFDLTGFYLGIARGLAARGY